MRPPQERWFAERSLVALVSLGVVLGGLCVWRSVHPRPPLSPHAARVRAAPGAAAIIPALHSNSQASGRRSPAVRSFAARTN